jgi:PAS domain S-box-containing protein
MVKRAKSILFCFLVVLGIVSPLCAATPYIVGIYENPPLAFTEKGIPRGFLVDLLKHIAQEEGWELSFAQCEWSECLERLEKGSIDILLPVAFSPQRAERFDFGRAVLFTNWGELYRRKNLQLESINDLQGKTIAVVPKDIYTEAFQNMIASLGIANITYVTAKDYEDVFRLIANNQADAGVASRLAGFSLLEHYPNVERTIVFFRPTELRIAATKGKHLDLLNRLDDRIETLKKDPGSVYHRLLETWVFKSTVKPARWVGWLALASIAALAVTLVIIFLLRRLIEQQTRSLHQTIEKLDHELQENERLRQALLDQNRFNQHLIENIQAGVIVTDEEGKITIWNTEATKWLPNIEEAASSDTPVWQIFPEAEAKRLEQAFELVLQGYDQQIEVEFPQNPPLVAQVFLRRIMSQNVNVLILIQDITALKNALRYYEEQWSLLQHIVDKMPLPLFIIDPEGKVTVWNEASERITGISKNDLLYRPLDLSPLFFGGKPLPIPALLLINLEPAEIEELFNGKIKVSTEFPETVETTGWIWVRDEKRYVKILASRLRDIKGSIIGYFQCARDITDEINLQRSLAEAQKAETISNLTLAFTHELNNILTIILGACDMMSLEFNQLPQLESYLNIIRDTVKRGSTVCNYFQKMGKKDESFTEKRPFNEIVQEIIGPLMPMLRDTVTVQCTFDPSAGVVSVRRTELEAVIFRLLVVDRERLSSANKISLETKLKKIRPAIVTPEVRIPSGIYAVLSINYETDKKLTPDPEESAYSPGSDHTSTRSIANGKPEISISFISQMVQQAGGYITIKKSREIVGVELYFPTETKEGIEGESTTEIGALKGKTIFIVEDDHALRKMIKASLELHGALVIEASSGDEALSLWQEFKNRVDIAIIDVVIPGGDGLNLFATMRADRASLPAVFISGYEVPELDQILQLEGTVFLPKPFSTSKLISTILELL